MQIGLLTKCLGTLPPGVTGSIYSMITQMKPPNVVLLVDHYQQVECLSTGKVDILKINSDEARALCNLSGISPSSLSSPAEEEEDELVLIGRRLYECYPLRILGITNGPGE